MFEAERIAGTDLERTRLRDCLRPPFRKYEFSTPMSPAHASRILQENVEPPRKWGWPTSSKRGYFEGKVAGSRFKFHRVIGYQNSFLPIIEGSFRRDGVGTVDREHAIGVAGRSHLDRHNSFPGVEFSERRFTVAGPFGVRMVVIAMTLFIYLVATVPFAIESRIALKRLLEFLRSGPALSSP